jgi:hypothetical protein
MKHLLAVPLAAGMALGCGLDFSSPVVDTAANLTVSLALVDSLPVGGIQLRGSMWPGYNAAGDVRPLRSTSLGLLGSAVLPYAGYQTDMPGAIGYSEDWPLNPGLPLGPVELRGPDVLGAGPVPVLRVTPPWPTGPASVTVARDSAMRLDLSVAPEPGDTVQESWRLDLLKGNFSVGQLAAFGPTPATIEVPWNLIAGLGGVGRARLTVSQMARTPRDGRSYAAALAVVTTHFWSMTVEP